MVRVRVECNNSTNGGSTLAHRTKVRVRGL